MKTILLSAAVVLGTTLLVAACDDSDDPVTPTATTFNVTLTKAAETTVCAGAGASPTGSATVTINASNTTITVSNLTFAGMSGGNTATAAHIHSGAAGVAGNVVIDFGAAAGSPLANPFNDTFVASDYIPASGAPATFAAFITAMKSGLSYINLHTAACTGGEIRGQLIAS